MNCKFHVGQRVVCVDSHINLEEFAEYLVGTPVFPIVGNVYQIADVFLCQSSGIACLDIVGLPPVTLDNGIAPAQFYWNAEKFSPIHNATTTVEAIKRKAIEDAANAPSDVVPVKVKS